MLRSKVISDYIEARLSDFKVDEQLPVNVHLYFSSNRHILVWRTSGEVISEAFVRKYQERGMERVWIHRDDEALWAHYLKQHENESQIPVTDEGREIIALLENQEQHETRKQAALVARSARGILAELALPTQIEPEQTQAMAHAREAVRDILTVALEAAPVEVKKIVNELWQISREVPDLSHGANVATFAVLFSMAFGRIDSELLSDIALASLLHDIGLSQVMLAATQKPLKLQLWNQAQEYNRHVPQGMRILSVYAPHLSGRIKTVISQHHEKFDGSGYPQSLQGFQVNDIAQLVSMADTLESMASGQWDGEALTIQDALRKLEGLEKARTFPEHFNPEVFAAVLRWMRDDAVRSATQRASGVVTDRVQNLMKSDILAS